MGKDDKTHINVVVIGHVDSGKSTTVSTPSLPPWTSFSSTLVQNPAAGFTCMAGYAA
jgi:translation initiation factor 2 gamma subunit (eIF-2gamma)